MNRFILEISENEKERILNLHTNAIKEHFIIEQTVPDQDPIYSVFYEKLGDKSKRIWQGTENNVPKMTDDDKNKILQQVKDRVNRRVKALTNQGKKQITFDSELNSIKDISISYKTETQEAKPENQKPTQSEEPIPYIATYPKNNVQNPDLYNFFLKENEIEVPEKNEANFIKIVNELKNAIPKNEVITEIHIKAGSTTSQVPTKYKGGDYGLDIAKGQKNNIYLAEDRCKKIEEVLTKIITDAFPNDANKIVIDQRDAKPNNGPVYTQKERDYYFKQYGKLDPNKADEYNKKYGPYKGSYGSVMILTKGSTPVTGGGSVEPTPPITVNVWKVRVNWEVNKEKIKKEKSFFQSSTGGIISIGGSKGLTNCAVW